MVNNIFNRRKEKEKAPCGTWGSPITSGWIANTSISLGQIALDGDAIYWTETRPNEGGRTVLVRDSGDGEIADITPKDCSIRSRVHEYGGGSFVVDEGDVWFCNEADQRIIALIGDKPANPLMQDGPFRFADLIVDRLRSRLIAVCEEHLCDGKEIVNRIVSVGFDKKLSSLIEGDDFYSTPRLSPDGQRLAWLSWNHPDMPWNSTKLWLADFSKNGKLKNTKQIAGGSEIAIFSPIWSPGGVLHFVSDKTGWWNLYRLDEANSKIEALCNVAAEFGNPHWMFGMTTFGFTKSGSIICTYAVNGEWRLAMLGGDKNQLRDITTPYCTFSGLKVLDRSVAFVAGQSTKSDVLVLYNLDEETPRLIRSATQSTLDPSFISEGDSLKVPIGRESNIHAFFYTPKNPSYSVRDTENVPLIVKVHGGPTSQTTRSLNLEIQYWTSRGFAVLDVNYGGSTGFGRAYRNRLRGKWGIVDVADCVTCVQYLVEHGCVDGERVAISGGSAGGFTVLCALTFHDVFKAGTSYYGIGDLESLARDTHKFESRYLDHLVGSWPRDKEIYRDRSPIYHTELLSCPVIFLQGLNDNIVPPNQAKAMVDALVKKNIPVAYVEFEDEGHGFRKSENVQCALDSELYFYGSVFGFQPADELKPVLIHNL